MSERYFAWVMCGPQDFPETGEELILHSVLHACSTDSSDGQILRFALVSRLHIEGKFLLSANDVFAPKPSLDYFVLAGELPDGRKRANARRPGLWRRVYDDGDVMTIRSILTNETRQISISATDLDGDELNDFGLLVQTVGEDSYERFIDCVSLPLTEPPIGKEPKVHKVDEEE